MTASLRWQVRASAFPFGTDGAVLGHVLAADRLAAENKARSIYGANVVVQSALSLEAEARERKMPPVKPAKRYAPRRTR